MRSMRVLAAAAALAAALGSTALPAAAQGYYTINGQPAPYDVALYMASNGLPPGHYWLDGQGSWGVMGDPRPYGNIYSGTYHSGSGSGEQAPNGWSHYNNSADYWVGGDNNGCIYTPDWSNC